MEIFPARGLTAAIIAAGGAPHKDTHKLAGADAFLPTDLLDATCRRLLETSGPTSLLIGSVADGEFLRRSGTAIIGSSAASGDDIYGQILSQE